MADSSEITVDALPYIDLGYDDPGVREAALAMVEEECRRYRPTKNYLDQLPLTASPFETKLMAQEFERIQNRIPMETLSMKRYELPPPTGKLSELSAWQESIENSMAQLEHQSLRAMNLELMLDYGVETWKAYLEIFTALQAKAQNQLQELKKRIQDVNWQRKVAQTQAGEKLKSLEATWELLVTKNYEIEEQCVELEKNLVEIRTHIDTFTKNEIQVNGHTDVNENENQTETENNTQENDDHDEEEEEEEERQANQEEEQEDEDEDDEDENEDEES